MLDERGVIGIIEILHFIGVESINKHVSDNLFGFDIVGDISLQPGECTSTPT